MNIERKSFPILMVVFVKSVGINKRVLNILYKDFKTPKPYNIVFHPYYLKQYNNRWFVFGLNEDRDTPYWNIALDRIEKIEETNLEYKYDNIDWEEYFYDIIGVTMSENKNIQEVVLKFSSELAPYIITKPLHPSQKHKLDEDGLTVRISIIPNYELERLIMSLGEGVTVLEPRYLKEILFKRFSNAKKNYSE